MFQKRIALAQPYVAAPLLPGPNLLPLKHIAAASSRRASLGVTILHSADIATVRLMF